MSSAQIRKSKVLLKQNIINFTKADLACKQKFRREHHLIVDI